MAVSKKKIIIGSIIIGLILVSGFICYWYYGGFLPVNIQERIDGGEIVVFEDVVGDYSQAGPVSNKLYYSLLYTDTLNTSKGFGVFYDNPQKVERSKLRSEVGCVLDSVDSLRLNRVKAKYKVKELPQQVYIVTELPLKGYLSILLGLTKVYPAITKYCIEKGYSEDSPVTEIYDMKRKTITYRKEIKVK